MKKGLPEPRIPEHTPDRQVDGLHLIHHHYQRFKLITMRFGLVIVLPIGCWCGWSVVIKHKVLPIRVTRYAPLLGCGGSVCILALLPGGPDGMSRVRLRAHGRPVPNMCNQM
eukprot:1576022-Amphidinium_carterae.1